MSHGRWRGGAHGLVPALVLALAVSTEPVPGGVSRGGAPGPAATPPVQDTAALARLRHDMVRRQIAGRGIRDRAVLRAMRRVQRHEFVPPPFTSLAYGDQPLPIGYGQTISQPYIVAFMAEAAAIGPADRVLEIGTGSGYGAAVLAELARDVYTIEIVPELADRARGVLRRLGYTNVHVRTGNGWLGWREHAPYDAIVVTAAPDRVPPALVDQLAPGGILVVPVGEVVQTLRVLRKSGTRLEEVASLPVRFVPMVAEPPDTTP
jgi:protein-L-isoaspartate(D-aspartate) O-methyltransferase